MAESVKARIERLRANHPQLDRLVRTQEHYSEVGASQQAGAVTYFGFLSVYPVFALAFFVVGFISKVFPDADEVLVDAINAVMPGLVGSGEGQLSLTGISSAATALGLVGLIGVLYAGLGWLSALRSALVVTFDVPSDDQPNMILGKLRDLLTLVVLGVVLVFAVVLTGLVRGFSAEVLRWLGLSSDLAWTLDLVALAAGLVANTVLFYAIFRLLARPEIDRIHLLQGAILGGIGFEVLKQLSSVLLANTTGQPAFQIFGVSLILLVWINYFSKITLYGASYACVGAETEQAGEPESSAALSAQLREPVESAQSAQLVEPAERHTAAAFVSGAATATVAWILMRSRGSR